VGLVVERNIQSEQALLSAKLVQTFADRGCRVVSAADFFGRNLSFLDRKRYYVFQLAPPLCS
jgi:hypothetical protein